MISSLLAASAFGALGIVLSIFSYFLFDLVERKIHLSEEIKNGNIAAALVMSSFIVGVCLIISRAIGG